jgi:hypothetical protein
MRITGGAAALRAARYVGLIVAALVPALWAQTANVNDLLATVRKQMQSADFRVSGHLIAIDPSGARVSYPITIKTHWFPGELRMMVELGQASGTHDDTRQHILLLMPANGANAIRIARPGDASPHLVPFEKWNEHPLGPGFDYEDFLEQQYFWPGQTSEGMAKFGARDCDVVKSTPGPEVRTHYAEVRTWIDPTIEFPVYAEKTLKDSGSVKEFTSYGVRQEEGHWFAHQVEVKTRGQAGSTLLIFDRGSAKAKLTASDFSPAALTHF